MFKKWRMSLGHRKLLKHLAPRAKGLRRLGHISQARAILIVAPAGSSKMYESCLRLQRQLQEEKGRMVYLVAWRSDRRHQPYLQQGSSQYVIEPHEVNWLFKPNQVALIPFTDRTFDYILDFTPGGELPLQWLVNLTRAGMKVGVNAEAFQLYDMVIELTQGVEGREVWSDPVAQAWQTLQQWLEGCE